MNKHNLSVSYYSYSVSNDVSVMILLPNYFVEQFTVNKKSSLSEIKDLLLKELRANPEYENDVAIKNNFSSYIFCGVNREAEIEEYYDESQLLCNLNLIDFVLNCLERKGNKLESQLTSVINHCIGLNLDDLPKANYESFDLELLFARKSYLDIVELEHENLLQDKEETMLFQYSADYNECTTLTIRQILQSMSALYITTLINYRSGEPAKCTICLGKDATVRETVAKVLGDKRELFECQGQAWLPENADEFVLKIGALELFLMRGGDKLIYYDYVQTCLYHDELPVLSVFPLTQLPPLAITRFLAPPYRYVNAPAAVAKRNKPHELDAGSKTPFAVVVRCAQLVCKEPARLYVRAALFSGTNSRISAEQTTRAVATDRPTWNERLAFSVEYGSVPRNARLCLSLVEKHEKGGHETVRGWANVNAFDHGGKVVEGALELRLWPPAGERGDAGYFHPGGATHASRARDDAAVLCVEFAKLRNACYRRDAPPATVSMRGRGNNAPVPPNFTIQRIRAIVERDPLSELSEQDIDFLRLNLDHCVGVPESLPRLARSIRWSNRDEVSLFHGLLAAWPVVSLEASLQLLSGNFFDGTLRSFTVQNLRAILTSADLNFYLLQLVQALKYESYYFNDLAVFLVQSALRNKQLGQKFFWFLKSEMHNSSVKVRSFLAGEARAMFGFSR